MILLVDSLRYTGCGDAFAQLKVSIKCRMCAASNRSSTICFVPQAPAVHLAPNHALGNWFDVCSVTDV